MGKLANRIAALFAVSFVCFSACEARRREAPPPPETKVQMVEDVLHGVKVADPYRWLEEETSEETQTWVAQQNAYARSMLDALPTRNKLRQRLTELLAAGSLNRPEIAHGRYFYAKREGSQNQPIVYLRERPDGENRAVLDPNQMSPDGTVAIDWFFPSKDGKLLAYGESSRGTETPTLHVLDVESGKKIGHPIPKVRLGYPQWLKDRSGSYYTRPRQLEGIGPGEEVYHLRVFYHKLGSPPAEDRLIYGEGLKQEEIPMAWLSPDERYLLLGDFLGWGKTRLYVKDLRKPADLITIADEGEASYQGEIVGNTLYLLTNSGAPRYQIFAVDLRKPERTDWRVIVPESDAVIASFEFVGEKLFVSYLRDAHSELVAFSLDGKQREVIPLPEPGTVADFHGEWDGNEAFFEFTSFTTPSKVYRLDLTMDLSGEQALTVFDQLEPPIDPALIETRQVFYNSKDGTRVPMYVIHNKGVAQDGRAPGLLTGYGGFNISLTPGFRAALFPWIESGGVLAIANLRGGSEYGEDWHRAGMLGNKQNVFDDFIAAAEYLVAEKHVDPERLAIYGRSNGGLLVGAAITQRPGLFRAVICGVPLLDMVRYHRFRMARLWISEYGSADNAEEFQWLYAYSPYHRVQDGVRYPATLIFTGETDSRVDPLHARKMVARLQAASSSGEPILLRVETAAGHGRGKPLSKSIDEWTDIWSFAFAQVGISY